MLFAGRCCLIVDLVWCCRLVATDEENKRLKIEMSEIKARHKIELQQVQKKMEQEMEDVHQRCVCIRTCVRACVCMHA